MMHDITNSISDVRAKINAACIRANRSPSEVSLIAVSKTRTVEEMEIALQSNITDFGENRVQELAAKMNYFDGKLDEKFRWHQIGRLQTNKVKYLIGKNVLIHSVDRLELAKEINRLSQKNNLKTDILIQVNVSNELSKAGIACEEVDDFLNELSDYDGINIKGFMTMAPKTDDKELIRKVFSKMNKIYIDKRSEKYHNRGIYIEYLSMGMSSDYEIAVEQGANLVRVGTEIFGKRI